LNSWKSTAAKRTLADVKHLLEIGLIPDGCDAAAEQGEKRHANQEGDRVSKRELADSLVGFRGQIYG
jgi:hypothetical protein